MLSDRRSLLLAGLALASRTSEAAAHIAAPPAGMQPSGMLPPMETIVLWPNGATGMPTELRAEQVIERSADPMAPDRAVLGITCPRLAVFRPEQPNSASVLLMPGGGYNHVVVDKEGYEMARWLAVRGYTAFVLFYRLPAEGWSAGPDVCLADAQRAIRLIRHHHVRFAIDPERVGAMGFSAGGHLCADLAARFAKPVYQPVDEADLLSARPACAAPIYPVISMSDPDAHAGSRLKLLGAQPGAALEHAHSPHLNIPADAPPHWILHAEDDAAVPVQNSLLLRGALKAQGIPVETHLFARGGHGFGLRKAQGQPVEIWPQLWLAWAQAASLG